LLLLSMHDFLLHDRKMSFFNFFQRSSAQEFW
jgi:hypothetical protein